MYVFLLDDVYLRMLLSYLLRSFCTILISGGIMLSLARRDQESVILTFERAFGRIITNVNQKNISLQSALIKTSSLSREIRSLAKARYFDEDVTQQLEDIASAIDGYSNVYLHRTRKPQHAKAAMAITYTDSAAA
jgi:predicted alpha/beta-fold hydrolase